MAKEISITPSYVNRLIRKNENVVNKTFLAMMEALDCGKTYMACAFGMEACKQYFNTGYVRLPDLLIDLEIARSDGNYKKVIAKYANPLVFILDELPSNHMKFIEKK